jgi:tRNA (guanine-N7-)-methyltransferase
MSEQAKLLRPIRSFIRRQGRLSPAQGRAIERYWPRFGIEYQSKMIDMSAIFGRSSPIVLEIGFGMGASLFEMASQQPALDFIGIEIHTPGIGSLLNHIAAANLQNIRIINHDAVEVLNDMIQDASLSKIQIFFPDPWPKKRHHKRRLIQVPFVEHLLKKLAPGGLLHIATDWEDYARHIQEVLVQVPSLREYTDQANRPKTKYESRGRRLGHEIWDFVFEKA